MPLLDMRTLLVLLSSLNVLMTVFAFATWRLGAGRMRGPGYWFCAFALIAAGTMALSLRGVLPDLVTIVAANSLLFAGISFQSMGVFCFLGRPFPKAAAALLWAAATLFFAYFGLVRPSLAPRLAAFAAYGVVVYAPTALALLRRRGRLKGSALFAGLAFAAFSLIYLYRFATAFAWSGGQDWFANSQSETFYLLAAMLAHCAVAFAELELVNGSLLADLAAAAEEKALLLREMNHRTKNNLALADSLVSLEAGRIKDPAFVSVLEAIRARLRTIGLVHDSLYRADSGSAIRLDEYLGRLLGELRLEALGVKIESRVQAIALSADSALSIGLVVNELVTNCLKYAFPPGGPGTILVSLGSEGGRVRLIVRDDGKGLPESPREGLGGLLVDSLAEQLGGRASRRNEGGAVVELDFPLVDPRRPSSA